MIEIKSVAGNVLYTAETATDVRTAVEEAVREGADLANANLYNANLCYADLRYARLGYANLCYADLRYARLAYADLAYANPACADLRNADLYNANLACADLRYARLGYANLACADLRYARLGYARLACADLRNADLCNADLRNADLRNANLRNADLGNAGPGNANLYSARAGDLIIASTRILPDEGSVIGWKRCANGVIVKLKIPAKAKRSHAFGRKCRASEARVLSIFGADRAVSIHDPDFVYRVGETVRPTNGFDDDWTNECGAGIHFFITRLEAENCEI